MIRRAGFLVFVLVLALITVAAAVAADGGRTPVPAPAKAAKGAACVEPVEDMRRNHMVYLEHERDETMRKGIRGRKHSLKTCVECHAVADAQAAGVKTVRPFCAECHRYAAVSIDCFQCHNRSPDADAGGPSATSAKKVAQ